MLAVAVLLVGVAALQVLAAAMAARPGVAGSRRLLAGATALLVPIAGPILAILVRHARGRGAALAAAPPRERAAHVTAHGVLRTNGLPPILDRLMSSDASERLAALVHLPTVDEPTVIALLRFTVERGGSEAALDAALALEEVDVRRVARREAARAALDESPSFQRAMAAAEAAVEAVVTPLDDGPCVAAMATIARDAYRAALRLAPERSADILERLARLELHAGDPLTALEHLARLAAVPGVDPDRLAALRAHAAFAARCFALTPPTGKAATGT